MSKPVLKSIMLGTALFLATGLSSAYALSESIDVLSGAVDPGNCSGAVVRLGEGSGKIYVLTNGHCWPRLLAETLRKHDGKIVHSRVDFRNKGNAFVTAYARQGQTVSVEVTKMVYATMDKTDIALYEVKSSGQELADLGVHVFNVRAAGPKLGESVEVISAYWKQSQSCRVDRQVDSLKEDVFHWTRGFVLNDCEVVGGWSGSPVVSRETGEVVAIINTTNEQGEFCSLNNPCEVSPSGKESVVRNVAYAQRTQEIVGCVKPSGEFDLSLATCALPKP